MTKECGVKTTKEDIQAVGCTPVVPALSKQREGNHEFKVILGYTESSRPA